MQRVLGFMSGTSLDGIDMAVLETDGQQIGRFGPSGEAPLPDDVRALVLEAIEAGRRWARGAPEPAVFAKAEAAITEAHVLAAVAFLDAHDLGFKDLDLLGFHGQTILHEPPTASGPGRTRQLGDGPLMAALTGVRTVFDFRTMDVAAGGQGAPLVPVYHAALSQAAKDLKPPLAIVNIGGVANVTLVGRDGELQAFDTGPGNGPLDQWVSGLGLGRFDQDGALSASGQIDLALLDQMLAHPFFAANGPKSLDRYDFNSDPVASLSAADGAATLAALVVRSIALGLSGVPEPLTGVIVCGGGRHNRAIMAGLSEQLSMPVLSAEQAGWNGDATEAQAFGYLAARTLGGLAISFPGTTGVPEPMTGGRLVAP
jgi:anhydro-N-acetylmuramic acid kinase